MEGEPVLTLTGYTTGYTGNPFKERYMNCDK
jgi:hypothetical protein